MLCFSLFPSFFFFFVPPLQVKWTDDRTSLSTGLDRIFPPSKRYYNFFISKKQRIVKSYVRAVRFERIVPLSILWIIVQEMHRRLIKWNFKCASIKRVFLLIWKTCGTFLRRERYARCHAKIVRDLDLVTVRLSAMKHGLSSSMRLLRAGCIAGDARERWLERGVFLPRDNFEMLSDCSQAGQLDLSNIDPG